MTAPEPMPSPYGWEEYSGAARCCWCWAQATRIHYGGIWGDFRAWFLCEPHAPKEQT